MAQLREDGAKMLGRARLAFSELKVYGTPRRLVLIAEGMAERQAPETREERGPAAKVAFDSEGKPTKAALGFAKRHNLAPDALVVRDTDQGKYVFAIIEEPELPAKEALAPLLPGLITGLSFPKSMRWGEGKLRFGRPIRWLLALVDADIVDFELDGIRSGRLTRGHPVLADGMHEVVDAAGYEKILRGLSVLVDPDERLARLREQLETVEREVDGWVDAREIPWTDSIAQYVQEPEKLSAILSRSLDVETTFLVEHPRAAAGSFDPAFLVLPTVVLIEEMKHVQSYFPVRPRQTPPELAPRFVAVRDGGDDHLDRIIDGWESVLRSKLIDAKFFFDQDSKTGLADQVEKLHGVSFHEKLGSMYEKMERIRAISASAASQVLLSAERTEWLAEAAYLCKADLVTEVVQELSNLQGTMGAEYARREGRAQHVWEAVRVHYRPRFADDPIPDTDIGKLLALSDKLDTLGSLFAVGITPSGSADPFGLRREAHGVVKILDVGQIRLSLSQVMGAGLSVLRGHVDLDKPVDEIIASVLAFLADRLSVSLREEGIRYDLVDAALAAGVDDLSLAARRARALQQLSDAPSFLPTVIACTRPMNISKGFGGGDVDPSLFEHESERGLWEAYQQALTDAESANLVELFALFSKLREPIDRFFDDVLVMHEDERIRNNRLAICWHLAQLFRRLADFTLIVQA